MTIKVKESAMLDRRRAGVRSPEDNEWTISKTGGAPLATCLNCGSTNVVNNFVYGVFLATCRTCGTEHQKKSRKKNGA